MNLFARDGRRNDSWSAAIPSGNTPRAFSFWNCATLCNIPAPSPSHSLVALKPLTLSRPLDVNYVLEQGQGQGHLFKYLISGLIFHLFSCLFGKKKKKKLQTLH